MNKKFKEKLQEVTNLELKIRKCSCCDKRQSFDEFVKDKRSPLGISYECKTCTRKRTKKSYHLDVEKSRLQSKEKVSKNPERYKEIRKRTYYKDLEKTRSRNREEMRVKRLDPNVKKKECEKSKEYAKEHRDIINTRKRKRYHEDSSYKLITNLRSRVLKVLKQNSCKSNSTLSLLGCSLDFAKNYLINQFNLAYDNNRTFDEIIQNPNFVIDHIIPCDAFDLDLKSAQSFCFYYSNLQILSYADNDKKSDFIFNIRARDLAIKLTGLENWLGEYQKEIIKCK